MSEQQRQSLCPRLIDYLAIVGSRSANIKHTGNGQNPPVQVISTNKQNLSCRNRSIKSCDINFENIKKDLK